ncbi:methyl-accepting chemotaxis protein [Paenibacillus marinisediminis]
MNRGIREKLLNKKTFSNLKFSNLKTIKSPIRSIGGKLFTIFVVSIIFFVFTVGMISYSVSKSAIEHKVTESTYQTMIQGAEKVDMMLDQYNKLSLQVMFDKNVSTLLSQVNYSDKESFEYFQGVSELHQSLQNYTMGNDLIENLYLIPLDTEQPTFTATQGKQDITKDLAQNAWYEEAKNLSGDVLWIPTMVNGIDGTKSATFALARSMKNTSSTMGDCIVVVEIKYSALERLLFGINTGEGSTLQLINDKGQYIYSPDRVNLSKTVPSWLMPEPVADNQTWTGSEKTKSDEGEAVLNVYHEVKGSHWLLLGSIPEKELYKDANMILIVTFISIAVATILALVIGSLIIRMVSKPLKTISGLMKEGAEGRLSVRAEVKSKDEIGELSGAFNTMMEQISSLVKQTENSARSVLETASSLSEASKSTAISAKEIAVATEEIAKGATSLAVEAERGNDLTTHMASQMQKVLDANKIMDSSAQEVDHSSSLGASNMNELMDRTSSTGSLMRSLAERVNQLSDSAASIRKIMDVLNNMTKQTNILSLNATIEAARAGAAGKGFMVVADEIRNLADQSHQSIDVVNQITERIQQEINETIEALSSVFPIFEKQTESVKETDSIFGQVRTQMSGMIGNLEHVTGSIEQLHQAQFTLVEAMSNVSAVAEEASATSEEVASLSGEQLHISSRLVELSQQLEDVSTQLKESLTHFRFD